ncbi:class I adenylate-forming enzyme family protein [Bradyrhizobium brasilense]|uniref:class I adenylate-forming enzyme family protein n=1 Tax=Bradyrhizobium brasilense TaxID=1419277 RepID=UPI0024B19ABE|nr:class I adenylate-forming enzyme family protein [Bradyrhizobium australafricanum]WFU31355.1 class I adenylate-forming enzyme family protein [Bradyrhizobium australafricanum]
MRRIEALESAYESITVAQLVSLRARTHGSATAIDVFERGERVTYSEMDIQSNSVAHALRAFGVRKGDRIGVMLPNRVEFPILWFAIAKLGAVIVPINMRYTPREIEYVLSDTQAKFAVVDESAWPMFSAMDPWPKELAKARVLLVGHVSGVSAGALESMLNGIDRSPVEEDVCPDDLLVIQFTSGTTGFPKGCMLSHEFLSVASYASASLDRQVYGRHLSWAPFFYAEGQGQLMKSYRLGGTLYLAQKLSSTRFLDWLTKYRIEWCSIPEQIARQSGTVADACTCLKEVQQYVGWSADSIRQFRRRFRVPGYNVFGMTEIGWGTRTPIGIEVIDTSDSVGIRAPFRELLLVNDDGSPTPVGEVGELWVRGRGLFNGYWNNAEANAAAFEGEWFKTGDLFRCDELGFFWIVGRKKDVIRRSSENIAAREVEAIIRELPEIADVAAVPVRDAMRGEEVKICVELKGGIEADDALVDRILEHARARLAVFKVPRYIAFTAALPRTSSDKVLKRELMAINDPISGAYDSEQKCWR